MNGLFRNHDGTKNPVGIWILIGLNTLFYVLQMVNSVRGPRPRGAKNVQQSTLGRFVDSASTENLLLIPSQVYEDPTRNWKSLISSMFAHGNLQHLLFNMLALYQFGRPLENRLGFWRTLAIYLVGGIGSNIVYTARNASSNVGLLGASAGVSAILGAYFVEFGESGNMVSWVLFQLVGALMASSSGISYVSHIYGLIIGMVVYFLVRPKPLTTPTRTTLQ